MPKKAPAAVNAQIVMVTAVSLVVIMPRSSFEQNGMIAVCHGIFLITLIQVKIDEGFLGYNNTIKRMGTMTNNDLLRRLRYALNLNGVGIAEVCALGGHEIGPADVLKLLKKEDEHGFVACDDMVMGAFLDGLITSRRGPRDTPPVQAQPSDRMLNNNLILRKLRIALELNDVDMLAVFRKAGASVSKAELSALFRGVGQRNYKECGDQLLRNFVRGLTLGFEKGGLPHNDGNVESK